MIKKRKENGAEHLLMSAFAEECLWLLFFHREKPVEFSNSEAHPTNDSKKTLLVINLLLTLLAYSCPKKKKKKRYQIESSEEAIHPKLPKAIPEIKRQSSAVIHPLLQIAPAIDSSPFPHFLMHLLMWTSPKAEGGESHPLTEVSHKMFMPPDRAVSLFPSADKNRLRKVSSIKRGVLPHGDRGWCA
ncbi:hypothetical protein CEXT_316171 [Caerostris extrusa]|uniref:Uncharacterized protein n=1 Tax=Caerostris extrusa TaxID=172846 RepID=A0AAV4MQI8_CAEEX|nr:hypothetical protein CEXT_316171 [Caerostris extrusa]